MYELLFVLFINKVGEGEWIMFLQQLLNGLTIGTTYSLVAVGFTLIYGILQLINFAHGSFFLISSYLMLTFYTSMKLNFFLALFISIISTGIMGSLMDAVILKPIREKSDSGMSSLIVTLGMGTFLTNLLIALYGSETKAFKDVLNLGKIYVGSAIVMGNQIFIAVTAVVIMIILLIIVYRTRFGGAMRAISQNPSAAMLMGIPVNKIIMGSFFIGTVCAAISGYMVSMYYGSIDTNMYLVINLRTFAAAVLGGIGSLPGSMIAGIIIGVLETFVAGYFTSSYKDAVAFVIIIVVLIFRPSGLLGKKDVDKV